VKHLGIKLEIDEQAFAFTFGVSFRGLTISMKNGQYNCILRGTGRRGEPLYAMTQADEPQAGMANLIEALSMGGGETLWRQDRFASSSKGG
jgi:hypothetical protein